MEKEMPAITVELDDVLAEHLRRMATDQKRSEAEIVREAITGYLSMVRPRPAGIGKYRSGQSNGSDQARDLIRSAVKAGQWP